MSIITCFERIGFSNNADDIIAVCEEFSESNDFIGCYVSINGFDVSASMSVREALEDAVDYGKLDVEAFNFIINRFYHG